MKNNVIFYRDIIKLTPEEARKEEKRVNKVLESEGPIPGYDPTPWERYGLKLSCINDAQRSHNNDLYENEVRKVEREQYYKRLDEIEKSECERLKKEQEEKKLEEERMNKLQKERSERAAYIEKIQEKRKNQGVNSSYYEVELPLDETIRDGDSYLAGANYYFMNWETLEEEYRKYLCPPLAEAIGGRLYDVITGDEYCLSGTESRFLDSHPIIFESVHRISNEELEDHLKKLKEFNIVGIYKETLDRHFESQNKKSRIRR